MAIKHYLFKGKEILNSLLLLNKHCMIFPLPTSPVSHASTLFLILYAPVLLAFFQFLELNKFPEGPCTWCFSLPGVLIPPIFSWLIPTYTSNFSLNILSWTQCRCSVIIHHKACVFLLQFIFLKLFYYFDFLLYKGRWCLPCSTVSESVVICRTS